MEFGLHIYESDLESGMLAGPSALVYGYGIYLMGGGTPEGFEDLTETDVQILISTYNGIQMRNIDRLLKGIYTMFGGKDE